tara:strand:+ start:358 stop:753 length:396 start_codon:yes stop_codon:yes gene_type:complete
VRVVALLVGLKAVEVMAAEEMAQAAEATELAGSAEAVTVGVEAAGLMAVAQPAAVRWAVGPWAVGSAVVAKWEELVACQGAPCILENRVVLTAAMMEAGEGVAWVIRVEALSVVELKVAVGTAVAGWVVEE